MAEVTFAWLFWTVGCDGVFVGNFPDNWISPGDETDLIPVAIQGTYSVSAELPADAICESVVFRVTFDQTIPQWLVSGLVAPLLRFETPSIGAVVSIETHPMANGIQSLGLPVAPTLGGIGIGLLVLGFFIVSRYDMDKDTVISTAIFITAANLSLRLWPSVLVILFAFLSGFLIVSLVGGRE